MTVELSDKQIEIIWDQFDVFFSDTGQYFEKESDFIDNKEILELLITLYNSAPEVIENTYTMIDNVLEYVRNNAQQNNICN